MGHLRLQKLHDIVTCSDDQNGGHNENEQVDKNEEVFAELVQYLHDISLSLIIRDAKSNGRKTMAILRSHHIGTSKPRIIQLYTELTSLKIFSAENITDYVIRAETAASSLKTARNGIDDTLLIVMVLKGLPSE